MIQRSYRPLRWSVLLGGILAAGLLPAVHVRAQDSDSDTFGSTYRTGENTPLRTQALLGDDPPAGTQATDPKAQGPVRMARFAYVQGDVSWRPDSNADWSKATTNLPLRQGAEVWVLDGGRADIQFDDGSALRLGNGALAIMSVLYSDAQGEFTQITLKEGLATLHSRHADAVYQVDTPLASVKFSGATQVRFGVDGGSEIAVQSGSAAVEGKQGKVTLQAGNHLYLTEANTVFNPRPNPAPDSWDRWNSDRNRLIEGKSETYRRVPSNVGLVSEDLDGYGAWHYDSRYGWVWVPRVSQPDWRPYYYGNWVWVDPFGWTWVSDEPWGWAPYHYGTWVQLSYGWSWCPGPRYQYWSPGVVSFCSYGDRIGWAPLCPWEVRYPTTFGLGFGGRDWFLSFSIGWAGCYYPDRGGYCVGRAFNNYYANRVTFNNFRNGSATFDRYSHSAEAFSANNHFIPYNARQGAGATSADASAFGGRGRYQAVARGDTSLFSKGQTVSAPAGRNPLSGPASVQPTNLARTSTRSFLQGVRPPQSATQRSVTHAPLPPNVQRSLPASQERGRSVSSNPTRPGAISGNPAGRTASQMPGSMAGRGGAPSATSGTQGIGQARSAAEAARSARESIGFTGQRSSSGYSGTAGSSRSAGGYDTRSNSSGRGSTGYNDRNTGPSGGGSYGGGYSGSHSSGGYSGTSRSYPSGPGYGGGSYGGRSSGSSGRNYNGPSGGRSSGGYSGSTGGRSSGGSSSQSGGAGGGYSGTPGGGRSTGSRGR